MGEIIQISPIFPSYQEFDKFCGIQCYFSKQRTKEHNQCVHQDVSVVYFFCLLFMTQMAHMLQGHVSNRIFIKFEASSIKSPLDKMIKAHQSGSEWSCVHESDASRVKCRM